jgi:hypothetical protein
MLLFAEAGPGHLIDAKIDNQQDAPLVNAYGLINDRIEPRNTVKAVLFNKHDDRAVRLEIDCGEKGTHAQALWLMAPRPEATTDVTLSGNPVGGSGSWDAQREEEVITHDGIATIDLPPASAALVTFHFGGYK